nr:atherin-like [Aegilops tauschii subsp. strangulata]
MAAPPLAQKDGDGSRASAAESSSRDSEARPQEKEVFVAKPAPEAVALSSPAEIPKAPEPPAPSATANTPILAPTLPPPPSITPLGRDSSASPDALEEALSALTQLSEDLQGANRCLTSGRLELISGWLRSDASVKAVWSQSVAASEEVERAASLAAAPCDAALKDIAAAEEHCRVLKAEMEALRTERVTEACQREVREEELKAREDTVAGRGTEMEQPPGEVEEGGGGGEGLAGGPGEHPCPRLCRLRFS